MVARRYPFIRNDAKVAPWQAQNTFGGTFRQGYFCTIAFIRCPSAALKTGLMQDLLTGKVSVEPLLVEADR